MSDEEWDDDDFRHRPFSWLQERIPNRLVAAWYALRGKPVAYRLTIRNGGIDLKGVNGAALLEVAIIGAHTAIAADGVPRLPDLH